MESRPLLPRLIGYDSDDTILRGFARQGVRLAPGTFSIRSDDHNTYGQLVAAGAGIGFVAHYYLPNLDGVARVLPTLMIPSLPCWLAVHREIRGNAIVRRVYDFLAQTVAARLGEGQGASR